jgi:hypothetical protein
LPRSRPVVWAFSQVSMSVRASWAFSGAAQVQYSRGSWTILASPLRRVGPVLVVRPSTIRPVYLGLRRMRLTVLVDHVRLCPGGGAPRSVRRRAMPDTDSRSQARQLNMAVTQGAWPGWRISRARVAPMLAFIGLGWGVRSSAYP